MSRADMLADGDEWLTGQLGQHAAGEVLYARGSQSLALPATIGRSEFEIDKGAGVLEAFESRDYLIATAELTLGGTPTLPAEGDTIVETDSEGASYTYEVMSIGDEPAWRYSDNTRTMLRIHTKQIDSS